MFPLNLYAHVRFLLMHIAHETAGAARTRSSLRPLNFGGEVIGKPRTTPVARMRRCVWPILRDARNSALLRMRCPSGKALMVRRRQRVRAKRGPMIGSPTCGSLFPGYRFAHPDDISSSPQNVRSTRRPAQQKCNRMSLEQGLALVRLHDPVIGAMRRMRCRVSPGGARRNR